MKKKGKFRLYDKYSVDIWGSLSNLNNRKARLQMSKILFKQNWYISKFYRKWLDIDLRDFRKFRRGFGRKMNLYKKGLYEIQKCQYFYGIKRAYQLKRFYWWARLLRGRLVDNFVGVLESRILTILYRLNLVPNMRIGSQMILHHGIFLNDKRIKQYNYQLRPGDIVNLKKGDLERMERLRMHYRPFFSSKFDFYGRYIEPYNVYKKRKRVRTLLPYHLKLQIVGKMLNNKLEIHPIFIRKNPKYWLYTFGTYPPKYLEVSYALQKIMFVYYPRLEDLKTPYPLDIKAILNYYA